MRGNTEVLRNICLLINYDIPRERAVYGERIARVYPYYNHRKQKKFIVLNLDFDDFEERKIQKIQQFYNLNEINDLPSDLRPLFAVS